LVVVFLNLQSLTSYLC